MSRTAKRTLSKTKSSKLNLWILIYLAIGLCVVVWSRYHYLGSSFFHPDETIVTAVVAGMRQRGDLDTNWMLADLPEMFKTKQYNFSSYILVSLVWSHLFNAVNGVDYRSLSAFCSVLTIFPVFWIGYRLRGLRVAVLSVLFTIVAPILVQDAHYARPESFVTLLTMIVVVLSWPQRQISLKRLLIAGFMIGILVACKVSLLMLAFLPFVPLVDLRLRTGSKTIGRTTAVPAMYLFLAMMVGFAVGSPGAVLHPDVFYEGVVYLMKQYSTVFFYYSHPNGSPVADMVIAYLVATLGVWWLLAVAVGGFATIRYWNRHSLASLLLIFIPAVSTIGYFATKATFFERNFSHIIPLCCIGAALGVDQMRLWLRRSSPLPRNAVHALILGLMVGLCWNPVKVCRYFSEAIDPNIIAAKEQRVSDAVHTARLTHIRHWHHSGCRIDADRNDFLKDPKIRLGVFLYDYYDEVSPEEFKVFHQRFEAKELLFDDTRFPGIPFCSFHAYHSPRRWFYQITKVKKF